MGEDMILSNVVIFSFIVAHLNFFNSYILYRTFTLKYFWLQFKFITLFYNVKGITFDH